MIRLLIQHPHGDELSGVKTYVSNLTDVLLLRGGVEVRVVSTRSDALLVRLAAARWADHVHLNSNDLALALYARFRGKPVSIKYHWPFWLSTKDVYHPLPWRKRIRREMAYLFRRYWDWRRPAKYPVAIARMVLRLAVFRIVSYRLACSQFTADAVDRPGWVKAVPNPMAIDLIEQDALVRRPAAVPTFVFAGRLVPEKGAGALIEACARLAALNLSFNTRIFGSGPEEQHLRHMIIEFGLEGIVKLEGRVSAGEVAKALSAATALVFPIDWEDPAPYPPLEAAAQGVVTIGARAGGLPETAGPHALLYDRGDLTALVAAMHSCIADPAAAFARGQRAREFAVTRYAPEVALEAFDAAVSLGLSSRQDADA